MGISSYGNDRREYLQKNKTEKEMSRLSLGDDGKEEGQKERKRVFLRD